MEKRVQLNKLTTKQLYERYQSTLESIAAATVDVVAETEAEQQARIERLLKNYGAFSAYYFPHDHRSELADFHIKAANTIRKHPLLMMILFWFRGAAKSTVLKIVILWLYYSGEFRHLIYVSATFNGAKGLLADLQAELEANARLKHDFGDRVGKGVWADGEFETTDKVFFRALGRKQKPRGAKRNGYRPDFIVADDWDDDELSRNEKLVGEAFRWSKKALYKAMDMGRGRMIIANNKIAKDTISIRWERLVKRMAKFKNGTGKQFVVSTVNVLDKDDQLTWPQNFTMAEVLEEIELLGHADAQTELFNNPIREGAVFKEEWLDKWVYPLAWQTYDTLVAYFDPSWKSNATSDYKAIILLGAKGAELHVLDALVRKCSINVCVEWFYNLHERIDNAKVCHYVMEAGFAQDLHADAFEEEGRRRGYMLPLHLDTSPKSGKYERVEGMSPLFERGFVKFNIHKKNDGDMTRLRDQLLAVEPGSSAPIDGPDAMQGGVSTIQKYMRQNKLQMRTGKRQRGKRHW